MSCPCLLYTSDEHLGEGGPKAKFQANINAIRLLKELEAAGQQASPEQQEVLSRYVGWGGLALSLIHIFVILRLFLFGKIAAFLDK